ncbi:MAG TPA: EamA family transporter [Burkholderiales bacterium]|jgi:drug/metabolite transporter (DMT)-like permease|nr:EamA family transporter [Burkholderiales bacterium]
MPRSALLAAFGAIALWGVLAALSLRLRAWPPFLLVGTALLIGSLCSIHRLREWRVPPRVLALGIYGLFGFHFLLFLALRLAPPVEANLVNYLWPLFIVVLAPAMLPGQHLRVRHVGGAAAGFAGAALLVTGGRFAFDPQHAAGYAAALGSALIWATYSLATKRLASFPTATIGLFCAASGVLAIACHAVLEPRYLPSPGELPWLAVLGLGPMGAAFFLWDHALKRGDPRRIGALAYFTPLASTLVLVAAGQGELTGVALAAMALIIGGAVLGGRN